MPSAYIDPGENVSYGLIEYLGLYFSDCIDSHRVLGHQVDERVFHHFNDFSFIADTLDSASGGSIRRKSSTLVYAAFPALEDNDFALFIEGESIHLTIGCFDHGVGDDSRVIQVHEVRGWKYAWIDIVFLFGPPSGGMWRGRMKGGCT